MANFAVTLQPRPRLLALTGGDTLAAGVQIVESARGHGPAIIHLPDTFSPDEQAAALAELEARRLIEPGSARPEKQLGVLWIPGVMTLPLQWAPGDHLAGVGVTRETMRRGNRGRGVRVAVLDTDGFAGHDAFAGRDFSGDFNASPSHSHATHVVGLLAGERSADELFGVAPNVTLRLFNVLPGGSGSESLIADGYRRAVEEHRAQIISASLGGAGASAVIAARVQWARQQGVLCVSAAGNGGSAAPVGDPARSSSYCVMAYDRSDPPGHTSFTDGRHPRDAGLPRVSDPGDQLMSSLPGNTIGPASGTSMACPIRAGCIALLLAAG